jgi:hypothetical protein
MDLIDYTRENNKELWLVGQNNSEHFDVIVSYPHVKHFPPTWDLKNFLMNASETAGIQLGRTTIESWIAGKKSWIYKVDAAGVILSKELTETPEDVDKFYSENVAKQTRELFVNVLS